MFIQSHLNRLPILILLSFGSIAVNPNLVRADLSPLIFPQDKLPANHLENTLENEAEVENEVEVENEAEVEAVTLGESEENSTEASENQENLRPIEILLQLINAEREKVAAPPLQLSEQLEVAAQSHAKDMADNDFVTPVNPRDIDTEGRVSAAGYTSTRVAENLGLNYSQPQKIIEQWLESPGYRLSLLNPVYTEAGLGYANNPSSQFKHYWSLVLAVPGSQTAAILPPQEILLAEEGELSDEDPVLAVDGSHYDLYAFQGQAGQEITIKLESADFDTYVFLLDEKDRQIGENDDMSEDNKNSYLPFVLPEDGTYKILVNSYDPNSRGRYTISVEIVTETEL